MGQELEMMVVDARGEGESKREGFACRTNKEPK
jgi:hypothetical protein